MLAMCFDHIHPTFAIAPLLLVHLVDSRHSVVLGKRMTPVTVGLATENHLQSYHFPADDTFIVATGLNTIVYVNHVFIHSPVTGYPG